ncbi:MAG: ABC transporter ATP-binding protein [Actinomycetota bacterium]
MITRSAEAGLAAVTGEPSAVELVGVTKRFGDTLAVDSIDLAVDENRFFALLGPSGCGKTTTLRMIGGFEEPTEGTIRLHGEDVTGRKPYERPVNTVFQSYALFPHLSIFENVAFGLRRKKVGDGDVRRRVGQTLELVQLTGMEKRRPSQLSGGQQQRIALARALINHPRVLLLDEPLGALDLKLRKEMQIELKRIQHEVGITFIHVTHDQEEAMTMADSIAVMNEGHIERIGSPHEIYEDPQSTFVAAFLGSSNMADAVVVDASSGEVSMGGCRVHVGPGRLPPGVSSVRIGVRPEKLAVHHSGEANDANTLTGTVTDVSFIGVSTQYLIQTDLGTSMAAVQQNTGAPGFVPGERVTLSWAPEHTFVVR